MFPGRIMAEIFETETVDTFQAKNQTVSYMVRVNGHRVTLRAFVGEEDPVVKTQKAPFHAFADKEVPEPLYDEADIIGWLTTTSMRLGTDNPWQWNTVRAGEVIATPSKDYLLRAIRRETLWDYQVLKGERVIGFGVGLQSLDLAKKNAQSVYESDLQE
jgi:hypothetical protein